MTPSTPIYKLSDLKAAAEDSENLVFHGLEAQQRSMGLGYFIGDVARCVASLRPADYHKSLLYEGGDPPTSFDVYRPTFKLNEEHTDELYIKLALNDCGQIVIGSFKLL